MTTKIMVRIWNRGTVLARDYAVRILLPTIVANNPLYKDGLVAQDVAGIKYWRLQIGNGLSSPLFPKSEMIRDVEIPIVLHSNVPKPTGDSMFCTLYADEMPGIEREILLTAVLTDWS
jgi:hypothetical protein